MQARQRHVHPLRPATSRPRQNMVDLKATAGDAGLVRGFELDLVADDCGGESRTRYERYHNGNEEGCMTRDAEGDATDREVHHVMTFLWRAPRMFGRRGMCAG
jgi:hypothetical protein